MSKIPHFIVLGAHKAGTTSLHHYLGQHPEIFLIPQKGTDLLTRRKIVTLEDANPYLAQFEGATENQILGEVSSVYLHTDGVALRIKSLFPDIKLIAVLRNPIERAFSAFFWQGPFTKEEIGNFEEILLNSPKLLEQGLYGQHISTYLSYFNNQQLKLILFESLKDNKLQFFEGIYNFIGIEKILMPDTEKIYHQGKIQLNNSSRQLLKTGFQANTMLKHILPKPVRSSIREFLESRISVPQPQMSAELRARLIKYYYNDIILLQKTTGLDCNHWLET